MTNQNNIGDFFKNRLQSNDPANGLWDKPDPDLKQSILEKINTMPRGLAAIGISNLMKALLAALLISLIGSSIFLYRKNLRLTDHYATDLMKLENEKISLNTQLSNLEKEHQNTLSELEQKDKHIEVLKLGQEKTQSDLLYERNENSLLSGQLANHKQNLSLLREKIAALVFLEDSTPALIEQRDQTIYDPPDQILSLNLSTIKIPNRNTLLKDPYIIPETTIGKKESFFEVGYRLGFQSINYPIRRSFEKQQAVGEKTRTQLSNSLYHGLRLAVGITDQLKILTGINYTSLDVRQESSLVLKYNNSKERENDRGILVNDMSYSTTSPYAETRADFSLEIPVDLRPDDFLEFKFIDDYTLSSYQIPLEILYSLGSNNIRWFVHGGLRWNRLEFSNYVLSSIVLFRDRPLSADRDFVLSKNLRANQFFSTNLGMGLEYKLTDNLFADFSAAFNYKFLNQNGTSFSGSAKTGTSLEMGLNYRF